MFCGGIWGSGGKKDLWYMDHDGGGEGVSLAGAF